MRGTVHADDHDRDAQPIGPDRRGQQHARPISHGCSPGTRRGRPGLRDRIVNGPICKRKGLLLKCGPGPVPGDSAPRSPREYAAPHFIRRCSMQIPIPTSSSDSIADDPPGLRILCFAFSVLLAILPLAHVTALRNSLVGVVAVGALLQFRLAPWKNIPGVVPWLIWLAFAAAAIGWSALPDVSFQSFRTDRFYPFLMFLVSFVLVRTLGGRLAAAIGTAAGAPACLAAEFPASAVCLGRA